MVLRRKKQMSTKEFSKHELFQKDRAIKTMKCPLQSARQRLETAEQGNELGRQVRNPELICLTL